MNNIFLNCRTAYASSERGETAQSLPVTDRTPPRSASSSEEAHWRCTAITWSQRRMTELLRRLGGYKLDWRAAVAHEFAGVK
ncbi:hypothetical protein E2C01_004799 [Portunus trituberculatus]|uniref:Uncharacterized protein n=1 Tax=Portunus trituberculatus TaxID=210409 RepID=A0A5B7CTA8_PORTR|nr:hypothetical protein [Portunus trituberculatus]